MKKISRFAVEQYLSCKRCFVLSYKHNLKLRSLPFTLNSAVDNLCKNEFDIYRYKEEPHPIFLEHNIDAVPYKHDDIDKWRNNRQGIAFLNKEKGYHFHGAVDDVWKNSEGKLIIADVKTTSKKEFDWDKTWQDYEYPKGYKRQLEMYQWLFRKNGFEVSDTAYILYYNGLKNEPRFDRVLKFEQHIVKLECNDNWVEDKIIEAVETLQNEDMPIGSKYCDTCQYLKKRWHVSQTLTIN